MVTNDNLEVWREEEDTRDHESDKQIENVN